MGERQGERPPKIADIETPDNIARNSHLTPTLNV